MDCNYFQPGTCVARVANDVLAAIAKSFSDSASWMVHHMMTLWLGVPSPDVTGGPATWLTEHLHLFIFAGAFLAVLYAAYQMAVSGSFRAVGDLGLSFGRLVLVAGCTSAVVTLLLELGDAWATYILSVAHLNLSSAVMLPAATTPPGVTLLLALTIILTQLIQAVIMIVKNFVVVLLVGALPLTAAATNIPLWRHGFHQTATWLLAFTLYRPVAATIYAVAFWLSSGNQSLIAQLTGVAGMVMAVLALPAMMRLIAPATAAAASGNAGAMAGAMVGATIATGAVMVTSGAGGFAGAAAAMSTAPTGATSAVDSAAPEPAPRNEGSNHD